MSIADPFVPNAFSWPLAAEVPPVVPPVPPPAPVESGFELVEAIATRENVVRLEFNATVVYSGLGDVRDARAGERYAVDALAGARPVRALYAEPTGTENEEVYPPGSKDRFLDLYLDRPMSPYPAVYRVTVAGLWTPDVLTGDDLTELDTSTGVREFFGVLRSETPFSVEDPSRTRDFSNPISGRNHPVGTVLGSFYADETGDYATDEGDVSLRKRLFRRAFSRKGRFLHLGADYGVGLGTYGKKLLLAGIQASLATDLELQFALEPEVAKVRVRFRRSPDHPELVYLVALVKTRTGRAIKYETPVPVGV